jgi:hypothetical protein
MSIGVIPVGKCNKIVQANFHESVVLPASEIYWGGAKLARSIAKDVQSGFKLRLYDRCKAGDILLFIQGTDVLAAGKVTRKFEDDTFADKIGWMADPVYALMAKRPYDLIIEMKKFSVSMPNVLKAMGYQKHCIQNAYMISPAAETALRATYGSQL